jgi:hypothetical protein
MNDYKEDGFEAGKDSLTDGVADSIAAAYARRASASQGLRLPRRGLIEVGIAEFKTFEKNDTPSAECGKSRVIESN